jgi:hypothetical protein
MFVPMKAMVKPRKRIQSPNKSHFQKGMGMPRSSIQSFNPITTRQAKIPSMNQNKPLLKKFMVVLLKTQ